MDENEEDADGYARLDLPDATWTAAGSSWEVAVVYGEVEKRDWRWLWLRKRTEMIYLGQVDPGSFS
jgi:hypothetical protein